MKSFFPVKESYHVTVTLLMEYSDSLKESKAFGAKFKEAVSICDPTP
jgi:hypothetical protein